MEYPRIGTIRNGQPHLYLLLAALCCFATNALAQSNDLFNFSATPQANKSQSAALQGKLSYPIVINKKVSNLDVGQLIALPLPNGKSLGLTIDKKWATRNGDIQITTRFKNGGAGLITFGRDSVFANFSNRELNFGIGVDENRQAFLIDHSASTNNYDLGNDMRVPPNTQTSSNLDTQTLAPKAIATAGNKSVITLLAVYSPQFANGFANPITRINQMVAFTNQAYARSGIHIELVLAHAAQINFNNSLPTGLLLDSATFGTNDFTSLHALRDQHYADMVAVLPFSASGSVSGVAWVNGNRQSRAFSVSRFAVWGSDGVFAHELGHNLGSGHERISANPSQIYPCSGGYTGYSCGHGNGSQGTIMSYLNDHAWNTVFSNPMLDCNGEPCGIPQGQANAADNKTSFNITGPLIELFRVDTSNDDDKDGIKNDVDNCPNHANPSQLNSDDDALGDACDPDDDNDGINDSADNCPLISNPIQEDSDGNGEGDACQKDALCFPVKSISGTVVLVCL